MSRQRPFSVSQGEYPFQDHWFEREARPFFGEADRCCLETFFTGVDRCFWVFFAGVDRCLGAFFARPARPGPRGVPSRIEVEEYVNRYPRGRWS